MDIECALKYRRCIERKIVRFVLLYRSLASTYTLVDGDGCVDEDARFVGYTRLFLLILLR
jgi:hypothetical protein